MKPIPTAFVGTWRITAMDLWAPEAIDLEGPAELRLNRNGQGTMRFLAVEADLDCEPGETGNIVEFSWEGTDDCDARSGRGWVKRDGSDGIQGKVFFHLGDSSGFAGVRSASRTNLERIARRSRRRRTRS